MKKNTVLVVGSGAREHALGWKLRQSSQLGKIYFAPGTTGTALVGENTGIDALDIDSLVQFALKNRIDLTIAGPDDALAAGVVNAFQEKGLTIFGPTREAAQIESSKVFTKQLLSEEGIPTAQYKTFTNVTRARNYLKKQQLPIVIKASGLALGKGVIIANSLEEAEKAIDDMMVHKIFGQAGEEIVIEEFLQGKEVSIHAFSDGSGVALFPPSRDHKQIFEGNHGPNTGGMGTIAPVAEITAEELEKIAKTIVLPVIRGLKKRGIPFTGCLYPGLMMTKDGPKVIEINARFGDPEMESYMRLLDSDLFEILLASARGALSEVPISWSKKSACCIVLASAGYPGAYEKGEEIVGLDTVPKDVVVFHFATKEIGGKIVTNGGRVLGITAVGNNLAEALEKAYEAIGEKGIHFPGMQYRRDIGR